MHSLSIFFILGANLRIFFIQWASVGVETVSECRCVPVTTWQRTVRGYFWSFGKRKWALFNVWGGLRNNFTCKPSYFVVSMIKQNMNTNAIIITQPLSPISPPWWWSSSSWWSSPSSGQSGVGKHSLSVATSSRSSSSAWIQLSSWFSWSSLWWSSSPPRQRSWQALVVGGHLINAHLR